MKILLAMALFLPLAAAAQSPGYADADSSSEAVVMMKATMSVAAKMRETCGARYPQVAAEIDSNMRKWKAADRLVIGKAESYWTSMVKGEPKMGEMLDSSVSAAMKNLDELAAAPGDAGPALGAQYCKKHFEDLATGVWRTRTPRVYSFLEKAP